MEFAINDRLNVLRKTTNYFKKKKLPQEIIDNVNGLDQVPLVDMNENEFMEKKFGLKELILDGYCLTRISPDEYAIFSKFRSLVKLSCNQTGIHSLDSFPPCHTLEVLELTDNYIYCGLNNLLRIAPNVKRLELGGNNISDFNELEPLINLENLEQLGLDMNPLASLPTYPKFVFDLLTSIKTLDGCDKNGQEIEIESEEEEDEEDDDDLDGFVDTNNDNRGDYNSNESNFFGNHIGSSCTVQNSMEHDKFSNTDILME